MTETHFMYDPGGPNVEFHDTEAEALAAAEETLKIYREEASRRGEWSDEVEHIVVGTITHRTCEKPIADQPDACDYDIKPVAGR